MSTINPELMEGVTFDTGFVTRITDLPITNREKEVLVELAKGKTNKQISKRMMLSTSTIRNHISNIFNKLKITNRSQATAIAIYSGLLTPESFLESDSEVKATE